MSDAPDDGTRRIARPASVEDLKHLLAALKHEGVDTDLLLRPTREQGERVQRALMGLPDQVARELDPAWFDEGDTIRVADAFVVDLMFTACGESLDSLAPHVVTTDLDGVEIRTSDLKGLLKTKQTQRAKDQLGRVVLERALEALKDKPVDG